MYTVTGNRVKILLQEKAVKQGRLAEDLLTELQEQLAPFVARKRLTAVLNNHYPPNADEIFTIANLLKVPAEDIVILENSKP